MLNQEIDEIRFNASLVQNNQTQLMNNSNASNPNFMKKSMPGVYNHDNTQLVKMLDQLNESQVREVFPDEIFGMKQKLNAAN